MTNAQQFAGEYHKVKGKIKERFGQITDDDVEKFGGNAEQLIGVIQQKSGEARKTIERYLNDLMANASEASEKVAGQVREGYDRVASGLQDGIDSAQTMVRNKPAESMAVALGAGMIVGTIIGLLIGSRSK